MLLHNRNESPSNRHNATRLSVRSRLAAAASLPFSCPGCAPSSAAACPSPSPALPTAAHRCRGANASTAGRAHRKAAKPQPGWQQHLARNGSNPPARGTPHSQGSKARTTGCVPCFSHQPIASRLAAAAAESCSAVRVCAPCQAQCTRPPELLPSHCRKTNKTKPKHKPTHALPS